MKTTLNQLLNCRGSLAKLAQKDVPIRVAFRLSKLIKMVEKELVSFEEMRAKLLAKYEIPPGGKIEDQEKQEKFNKEFIELLNMEVELDFEPVLLSELGTGEINLSTFDIAVLVPFLKE